MSHKFGSELTRVIGCRVLKQRTSNHISKYDSEFVCKLGFYNQNLKLKWRFAQWLCEPASTWTLRKMCLST